MSEWLKEHAWKACVRETVPRVRIPLSPPLIQKKWPSHDRPFVFKARSRQSVGSCAMGTHEPRQVRKEATVSDNSHVPRGSLIGCRDRTLNEAAERLLFLHIFFVSLEYSEENECGHH